MAGTWAHGLIGRGGGFAGLWASFFLFSLIPSPTPSPHSFYFHVNFSTPFSPRHSEKSLHSPQQGSSFYFFVCFNFYSKTPHIYLYRELQPYTVLTFSVSVLDFFGIFFLTAAMHNLPPFPSLPAFGSGRSLNKTYGTREKALATATEPLFV